MYYPPPPGRTIQIGLPPLSVSIWGLCGAGERGVGGLRLQPEGCLVSESTMTRCFCTEYLQKITTEDTAVKQVADICVVLL